MGSRDPGRTQPTVTTSSDLRFAACILAATGFAALGHQVLWTRRMIDLLGASNEATIRVFVCFFLGLSLGSAIAATAMPRIQRPWRLLAWVELGVAFTCLPIILLPYWTDWIWLTVGPERLVSGVGVLVKTGLSLVLLIPPALLMGLTLPVVVSATTGHQGVGGSHVAVRLYAVNTLGGVAGLCVITGIGIQRLGVPGSMMLLLAVNLLVAALCYRRSLTESPRAPASEAPSSQPTAAMGDHFRLALMLAAFSGAGVMALEVLGLQLIDLSVPTSFYPPTAVLFCVILLLAAAALLVPRLMQRFGSAPGLIAPSLAAAAMSIAVVPLILLSFGAARTADLAYSDTFGGFLIKTFGLSLVVMGPAVLFCGLSFPLTICLGGGGTGRHAGHRLGVLLAVNGIAGVIGAEVARSFLVVVAGVHVAMGIVGLAYALASILFVTAVATPQTRRDYLWSGVALLVVLGLTMGPLRRLPLFYWGEAYTVVETRSGREGVLTVFEREGFGRGLSFNNQYLLGGSGSADDEQRQTHVPLLLHPAPRSVCHVGLGTGITASGSLRHIAVQSIVAVEISGMVVDAAVRHFGQFNSHIEKQAHVAIHVEDARTYVAACEDRFDAIIGDLFTPWHPGESGLASLEYFRSSKRALRTGGVFCQWFALHQLTAQEFEVIQSTFRAVFPEAYMFRNHLKSTDIPVALVGFKDGALNWDVVIKRCAEERAAGRLTDPLCRYAEGLAMLYFGGLQGTPATPRFNTLANLRVELDAGLNLVVAKPGKYYSYAADGNPWPALVNSRRASWTSDTSIPNEHRHLLEAGLLVTRLDVAYELKHPATASLEQQLKSAFPTAILSDPSADWGLWAGSAETLQLLRSTKPTIPNQ